MVESAGSLRPETQKGAVMFGRLGLPEMLVILFIIILIFGANRLPDIGRGIGKGIRNFKDATKEGANDKS
jgi:sec-independent protein translocase protein TatA